jgi:hypothetical protein
MPDVRHGCAARTSVLRSSRLNHSSSRAGTSPAHRLTIGDSRRCPLTSPRGSSSVTRRRNRHASPEHNHAHPAPLTARPPWLAVPPRRRYQAIRFSSSVSGRLASGTASAFVLHRESPRGSQCPASDHCRHPAHPRLISVPATPPTDLPARFGRPGPPQPAPLPFGRA